MLIITAGDAERGVRAEGASARAHRLRLFVFIDGLDEIEHHLEIVHCAPAIRHCNSVAAVGWQPRAPRCQSFAAGRNRTQSYGIRRNQTQSDAISSSNQTQSDAIRSNQKQLPAIGHNQRQPEAARGNQKQSEDSSLRALEVAALDESEEGLAAHRKARAAS